MIQKPMLSEFWWDVVSLSSAIITVVGFALTVVSLVYAIRQIKKTQSAAFAALNAANRMVEESRRSFERYTLTNALRYLAEAKLYINDSLWDKASLRLNDLSEQTAQLASIDPSWNVLTIELRRWASTLAQLSTNGSRFAHRKWGDFSIRLQSKIDERHGPSIAFFRGEKP